jgi:hypothetical protein
MVSVFDINKERKMQDDIHKLFDDLIRDYPTEYRLRAIRDLVNEAVSSSPSYRIGQLPPCDLSPYGSVLITPADGIAVAASHVLKAFPHPCYVKDLVSPLRTVGVALPTNDSHAAAAVMAKRKNMFRKYPGPGQKATIQWHLVDVEAINRTEGKVA